MVSPPGSPCAIPLPEDGDLNADLQPAHRHPEEPDVRRGDPGGSWVPPADLPEQGDLKSLNATFSLTQVYC